MENAPRAVQQGRRLSRCIVEVTSRSKRDRLFPAFEYLISAGGAPWIVVMDRVKGVPCTRRAGDGIVAGMRKPARAPGPVEAGAASTIAAHSPVRNRAVRVGGGSGSVVPDRPPNAPAG